MGLREDKKQQMRARLYDTAIELFRSNGFDNTAVREVITAVGVSEPTFYNYFPTKEAVLDEFAARTLDSIAEQLRTTIDTSSHLESTLREVMAALADVFSNDPEFMAVVATRSGMFWGPSGGIIERHLGIYELLAQLFETAQQRGEVRPELDPQQLAETLAGASMVATINCLNDWWGQPDDDLFRRLDQQADVLLNGCSDSAFTPAATVDAADARRGRATRR